MSNNNIKKTNNNKIKNPKSNKDSIKNNISKKDNNLVNNNIFSIVENNNLKQLIGLLKKDHSNINSLNNEGFSALHISVMKGNIDIIYHLLLNGANPNILSSQKKQTPLHLAYIYNNSKSDSIIKKLKEFKAKDNIYDIYNKKPIDYLNNDITKNKDSDNDIKNNNNKRSFKNLVINKDINSDFQIIKFSKMNFKIEGDIDNCENNEDSSNEKIIKKNNYIFNDSLNDSLEQENYQYIRNKNNSIIHSRNKAINKKNKTIFKFPNSFNNIIYNNLKIKKNMILNNKNNKQKFFNETYKNISVIDNQNKADNVFKELIKKKRQSIKYKKNYSYYKIKNDDTRNEFDFTYSHINKSTDHNKSLENIEIKKIKDKNTNSKTSSTNNNNTGFLSAFSTDNQTGNRKEKEKEKITIIKNKDVVEFKYSDSFTDENNYKNNSILNNNIPYNVLNKNGSKSKEKEKENINNVQINKNNSKIKKLSNELKNWLNNIGLSTYYQKFIENNIYDINILINQMKNPDTKLGFDDIESNLKMHKPGHIYRLLCKLEVDAGLINSNITNFLIKDNINKDCKNNNKLKLSISQENSNYINCFEMSFLSSKKKNDLNSFLNRYNLIGFYKNFIHNGFDLIQFVMLQMFSSEPIDEIILENCFHIYEPEQREIVLKCLIDEKNKINYFLNSNEYKNFELKDIIKYEDIIFDKNEDKEKEKIKIPNNNSCADCLIY